jgi:apolipoprotein N-acyltransferase
MQRGRMGLAVVTSAVFAALYARGGVGWVLGFVMLVPWLRALDARSSLPRTLLGTWAMAVAYTAAVLPWFGSAIGRFTQIGEPAGLLVLLAAAPLLQPQFFAHALVRRAVVGTHGRVVGALAATAAWVATERVVPKLLGDTLGYGLHPSPLLRQAADLGGAAGLSALLLLANEAVAAALARRADGPRAMLRPLAAAALVPLLLAAYGAWALATAPASATAGATLRMGLVQSNIVDYERLRRERGAGAVVREVLDVHFAMSYDAVERQRADAVLWSETVYPTTFGRPKSEAGAALDREILEIVDAAGVPFVFGTYDRDLEEHEFNAAAFVVPGTGLLGMYRKARPFPLTEYVPAWLDRPALRQWLPWLGGWQPGNGARVFPLRLRDGREIPVLPLICLDAVGPSLAIDGARLGATVILTMSNDAWFSDRPQGAELHQAVAAFRSIETRLPQFRVTTNGYSAVIDAFGTVLAGTRMGERTLVVGELPVREPAPTLMVRWGDWVGLAGAGFLVLLAATWAARRAGAGRSAQAAPGAACAALPATVALLPGWARIVAGGLRTFARGGLLVIGAAVWFGDGALQSNTLAQIRTFAALFLAPEAAAALLLLAFRARATIDGDRLRFTHGTRSAELPLDEVAAVEPWRMPMPEVGASLRLRSGALWPHGIAGLDATSLASTLAAAGGPPVPSAAGRLAAYAHAVVSVRRGWLDRPWAKFGLLPLVLAIPAFRLHQHIAYGSALGEYFTFGLGAYLKGFVLWWAAWAIGVVLCAAALRAVIEAGALLAAALRPAHAGATRRALQRLALVALYLGLPAWLLLRMAGA